MESKTKLTDAVVARAVLPDGKSEAVIWDSEVTGFGLRLRGSSASYIVSYRPAGAGRSANTRRVKIGTPTTIKSAAEARRIAFATLGKVAAGEDPAASRREQKRRAKAKVADLLDRYEADLKRRNYVARSMIMSILRRRLKKHAGSDIAEMKGSDFAAIWEGLEKAGLLGAADEFRSRCRAFLTFCQTKAKVIDSNPLLGFRKQRATRADRLAKEAKGRALSDTELAKVWLASDPATVFGRYVRFLALTGCRRSEGAGLLRTMIGRSESVCPSIEFPPAYTKQGRGHSVAITPTLQRLLDVCVVDARSKDLVFPSPRTGGEMSGWNKLLADLVAAAGVKFTFHDLRRTFRTGLARLGVDTETAELSIGHARANLIEIYDRNNGAERVRDAFAAWAEHLESAVAAEEQKRSGAFG